MNTENKIKFAQNADTTPPPTDTKPKPGPTTNGSGQHDPQTDA